MDEREREATLEWLAQQIKSIESQIETIKAVQASVADDEQTFGQ